MELLNLWLRDFPHPKLWLLTSRKLNLWLLPNENPLYNSVYGIFGNTVYIGNCLGDPKGWHMKKENQNSKICQKLPRGATSPPNKKNDIGDVHYSLLDNVQLNAGAKLREMVIGDEEV